MRDGAKALGWSFKILSRNADPAAYSPDTAGYIGMGDRSGAKLDVRRTYLRDACQAGARVIVRSRAERVLTEDGRASGVQAACADDQRRAPVAAVVACDRWSRSALCCGPASAARRSEKFAPTRDRFGCTPSRSALVGGPMIAIVDEFAGHRGRWVLLQVQGEFDRRRRRGPRVGRGAQETMARLRTPPGSSPATRSRHGSVTIDAAGDAGFATPTDESTCGSRGADEAQIRLHAAGGAQRLCRCPRRPAGGPATTLRRSSRRCSELVRRWRPVLGPPDEQLPNGCGPGDFGGRSVGR